MIIKTGYPLVPQDHGLISALETLSKHYVRTIIIIIIIIIKALLALFKTERPISEVREEDAGINR